MENVYEAGRRGEVMLCLPVHMSVGPSPCVLVLVTEEYVQYTALCILFFYILARGQESAWVCVCMSSSVMFPAHSLIDTNLREK